MSASAVPMFDPNGNLGDVPADKANAALKAGGRFAIHVLSPSGQPGLVPHDKVHEALAAGGTLGAPPNAPAPPVTMQESDLGTLAQGATALGQTAIGAAKGALRTVYNSGMVQGPQYLQGSGLPVNTAPAPQSVQPSNTAQKIGGYIETGAELLAPAMVGGSKAASLLPNAKRAGQAIGEVESAAGHLPLDTSGIKTLAGRVQELANRGGGQPPSVVSGMLKRLAVKSEGDVATQVPPSLTFREARDFYSNAGKLPLSDLGNMSGKMAGATKQFVNELGAQLQTTADAAGQGTKYAQAMKEYRNAKTLAEIADVVKKWGLRGLVTGATAKAGYEVLDRAGAFGK